MWQERTESGVPKSCCKNFKVDIDVQLHKKKVTYYKTKEEAYEDAVAFKEKIFSNDNVIKKVDIVEMSVEDYINNIDKLGKRNYSGYKVKVDFNEKELNIDPYIFGYWLGDGDSATCAITTADKEVVEVFETGEKEVYEVELDNGMVIKCTLDHKFICSDGEKHTVQEIMDNGLEVLYD